MKILITGATGYLGSTVARHLIQAGKNVVRTGRRKSSSDKSQYISRELRSNTDWSDVLKGVSHIVHTAARVHVLNERSKDPLEAFREVNVEGTLNLARQALQAGVKRFIFISTIGVNGSKTIKGNTFSENDIPHPHNNYALSKWEAEQGLAKIAAGTNMEVVVIRAPLIYGPNAPGNFGRLIKLVKLGIPLPFSNVKNRRSLIAIDNLVQFISLALSHPFAANKTYLVADDELLSTPEILRSIAAFNHKKLFLMPFPVFLMRLLAKLLGKENISESLFCSLVIDNGKARKELNWRPSKTMAQQLGHLSEKE